MKFITEDIPVKASFMSKEPNSSSEFSYVYLNGRGEHRLVENGEQLTNAEMRRKKFNQRFKLKKNQSFSQEFII